MFYPTAIGSEPVLEYDSMPHWRRCMQGHAAANIMPVIAANRIGREEVMPSEANAGQSSVLDFYGSSFLTNETGDLITCAGRDSEEILIAEYDLESIREMKMSWGIFRDRRPECYKVITQK